MNRQNADRALIIVFVLFIAAAIMRWSYRDAIWSLAVFRMAEAALVGGVADWFAVTALFRKPLGITFHTAIIPRSRDKIIHAMAYMVQEEFLSRQAIQRHLEKVRLVSLVIRWLEHGGKETVRHQIEKGLSAWLRSVDRPSLTAALAQLLQDSLRTMSLHGYAPRLAVWLAQTGKIEQVLDMVLAEARQAAARPSLRQDIYRYLENAEQQATGEGMLGRVFGTFLRTFDFVNLDEAADVLHHRLQSELDEFGKTDHPLRVWLQERLLRALTELEHNAEWQIVLADWKNGLVDRVPFTELLQPIVEGLIGPGGCGSETDARLQVLVAGVLKFVDRYWETFRQDSKLQDWLERHLQAAAAEVVSSEHRLIGELVTQAMGTLTDEELNAFIEDKVGEDLAWIRINGSVVGAIAGLIVFLLGEYVYLPYLWPIWSGR